MSLDRDIRQLLHCHDCVIVPHWGGFLTQYRPARLDEARKLVHPPGMDVSFNRNLVRNDGLLADHIAKQQGIGFNAASARIADTVAQWRDALGRSGRLEIPHVGIFYHDSENILQFEPDRRANFLRDAYGLRPVAAVPVPRIRPAIVPPQPVVVPMPAPASKEEPVRQRRKLLLPIAASVSLLLAVAAALYLNQQHNDGVAKWGLLNPFGTQSKRAYVPAAPLPDQVVSSAGIFTLPDVGQGARELPLTTNDSVTLIVDLGAPEFEAAAKPDSTHVVVPTPRPAIAEVTGAKRFHVVGGCFADPSNADRFLDELRAQGHDALRLPRNGALHPVAFGSYAKRAEALEALAVVRGSAQPSAWLLVR